MLTIIFKSINVVGMINSETIFVDVIINENAILGLNQKLAKFEKKQVKKNQSTRRKGITNAISDNNGDDDDDEDDYGISKTCDKLQ